MTEEKKPMGLWRKNGIKGGKYLVMRRDGTVPQWPHMVMGARDPAAPAALRSYANEAERLGMHPDYIRDIRQTADEFEAYRAKAGEGDPDRAPHRKDDPWVIAKMTEGAGSV